MTSKRFNQIKDIYESIIIQEATSFNQGWMENLAEEDDEEMKALLEKKKQLEEELTKQDEGEAPPKVREEVPELPGQFREEWQPEQVPMFPGTGTDLPFKKVYAPSFTLFAECPICKTKINPIKFSKETKEYEYVDVCPKCEQLYNRMLKLVEEKGLSPKEAIAALSTSRYGRDIMKKIWESQGSIDLLKVPIQKDTTPSIKRRVEDALRFRLNVKRDKEGKVVVDPQTGLPTPLYPPQFVTTQQLAKQLRWSEDHLVDFLEEKGFSPIPLGGTGKVEMPGRSPLEQDMTPDERRLRALQLTLKRLKNPQNMIDELQRELQHLQAERVKLETPGGPGTPGLNPKHAPAVMPSDENVKQRIIEIKKRMPLIMGKIKKLQEEMQKGPNLELQKEIEEEIGQLERVVREEEPEGKKRFKTSWYNVWNLQTIGKAIEDRKKEVRNIIIPVEKAMYLGQQAKAAEKAGPKLQQLQERLAKEKEKLKDNLDSSEKRAFRFIYRLRTTKNPKERKEIEARIQKSFGFDAQTLIETYEYDLDRYLHLQDDKNTQIKNAKEKEAKAKEKAEEYADKFIKFTTKMGFVWQDKDGNPILDEEAMLEKLQKLLAERTETLESEASLKSSIKQAIEKQLPLWEEEEEKEPEPVSAPSFGPMPKTKGREDKSVLPVVKKKVSLEEELEKIELKLENEQLSEGEKEELMRRHDLISRKLEPTSPYKEPITPAKEIDFSKFEEGSKICPYKGCGATIPANATTCWKCKSPIAGELVKQKVVDKSFFKAIERKVRDPETGEEEIVEGKVKVPRFMLVTLRLGLDGKPVSAKCQKLQMRKGSRATKAPTFPDIYDKAKEMVQEKLKEPGISDKEMKHVKDDLPLIYKDLAEQMIEAGEMPKRPIWIYPKGYKPSVGLPTTPCETCPKEVKITEENFDDLCDEIRVAVKSLTKPSRRVWDYKDVRLVTDTELEKGVGKQKGTESKPWYLADDKKVSRFDRIVKLLKEG